MSQSMPTNGAASVEDRRPNGSPKQQIIIQESKFTRQESKLKDSSGEAGDSRSPGAQESKIVKQESNLSRQESRRKESGEGPERRLGQLMEGNGLKPSGLFGFVQYLMDRPDGSPSSGTASPVTTSTLIHVTSSDSPAGHSSQPNSTAPTPDAELVKSEVYSDGNRSDKSDGPRNEAGLETVGPQNSRSYLKSEEYRQLFHLPPEEVLVEDFNCALQKKILLQGHMYLFERYVCFYSNIFGYEKKKVIPLKDITCVRKAKTAGVFPNAIEITSWGKKHFFASFLSRDEAYRLIISGWSQYSGYARLFLGSQDSPMSSPHSQGRMSSDSASWRSPLRANAVQAEETYTPRNMEEVPNLVAPSIEEATETASVEGVTEAGDGENSAEGAPDERLSVNESSSNSTTSTSPLWEPEDAEAPVLPESYKTVVESEFAVDTEEFFQLFYSDEAIGFSKDFHAKCGDDDFRCTQWAKHRHFGHARDISFRHPINFYFGPKSTYCHESQRFRIYRNSHLVLETSQQMTDIPYGDYFRVEVRWDVERLCGKGKYHCFVRISLGVTFCKKTVWKGKIEQGTHEESKEAYTIWIRQAHKLLEELRSLNKETGPAGKLSVGPRLEANEAVREGGNPDEIVASIVGQPARSLLDEPEKQSADEAQESRFKFGLGGRQLKKGGSALIGTLILISQKIWNKGHSMDAKTNKQLKLLLLVMVAVIIVLMQVGIVISLARSPRVEYVPLGYPNSMMSTASCTGGGSRSDEALAWLEQRARQVKEEIVFAEARLQTLHQDLTALTTHASRLLNFVDRNVRAQQSTE